MSAASLAERLIRARNDPLAAEHGLKDLDARIDAAVRAAVFEERKEKRK